MCLLIVGWNVHPRYRLVVAANRDEYHARAAAPLDKWTAPDMLAGRDLQAGGTWLGIDRERRFAVVTNFRELQQASRGAISRGSLIPSFLAQKAASSGFVAALESQARDYSGFNLLLADGLLTDGGELRYACNRAEPFARPLPPGIYGLSNHFLDSPWPKLARVRLKFETWMDTPAAGTDALFAMLDDRQPPDPLGPSDLAGPVPAALERAIAAPFVLHPGYGTRCSTVLLLEHSGALTLTERRFDSRGLMSGQTEFRLNAGEWAHPTRNPP